MATLCMYLWSVNNSVVIVKGFIHRTVNDLSLQLESSDGLAGDASIEFSESD